MGPVEGISSITVDLPEELPVTGSGRGEQQRQLQARLGCFSSQIPRHPSWQSSLLVGERPTTAGVSLLGTSHPQPDRWMTACRC